MAISPVLSQCGSWGMVSTTATGNYRVHSFRCWCPPVTDAVSVSWWFCHYLYGFCQFLLLFSSCLYTLNQSLEFLWVCFAKFSCYDLTFYSLVGNCHLKLLFAAIMCCLIIKRSCLWVWPMRRLERELLSHSLSQTALLLLESSWNEYMLYNNLKLWNYVLF